MKNLFSFFALFLWASNIKGQSKQDYEWATNVLYSSITSYKMGNFKFDRFIDTATGNPSFYFGHGLSNISDSNGKIKLMSNGYNVIDKNKNFVDGLDSIGGRLFMDKNDGFAVYSQYSIFLPCEDNIYYFINNSVSDDYWNYYNANPQAKALFDELLYCKIDMNGNGGAGKVLEREIKIIEKDTLSNTQMMACKHANGKDWWLLKQAREENKVFTFLFTKDSVINKGTKQFNLPIFSEFNNGGQSMFSQDGKKYATTCRGTGKIFLADFDRCTGVLSNPLVYDVDTLSAHSPLDSTMQDYFTEGLAFSPNGRFIYLYMYFNIQQLDLWDNNPATRWSVVAELDTTWDAFQSYSNMQLGPDNKLYIGNWGSVYCKQMSYFNNPDAKGLASDFCPRCLRFPNYGVTRPPCMPNYDLGAEPCWPLANEDLMKNDEELEVYPNPASTTISIRSEQLRGKKVLVSMYNIVGQEVLSNECYFLSAQSTFNIKSLQSGVYLLKVGEWVRKVVVE